MVISIPQQHSLFGWCQIIPTCVLFTSQATWFAYESNPLWTLTRYAFSYFRSHVTQNTNIALPPTPIQWIHQLQFPRTWGNSEFYLTTGKLILVLTKPSHCQSLTYQYMDCYSRSSHTANCTWKRIFILVLPGTDLTHACACIPEH